MTCAHEMPDDAKRLAADHPEVPVEYACVLCGEKLVREAFRPRTATIPPDHHSRHIDAGVRGNVRGDFL